MKKFNFVLSLGVLAIAAVAVSGCAGKHGSRTVKRGEAILESKQNASVKGKVVFEDHFGALIAKGQLTGIRADRGYKVQVHEKGDCSAHNASSAGMMLASVTKAGQSGVAANGAVNGEVTGKSLKVKDVVGKSAVVVAVDSDKNKEYKVACGIVTSVSTKVMGGKAHQCKNCGDGKKCEKCHSMSKAKDKDCGNPDCKCGKDCKCGTNCKCGKVGEKAKTKMPSKARRSLDAN